MKNTYDKLTRFFDILICIIAIIFLLPIFLLVSLILRFTGENEVFYLQERVGREKNTFFVYKFATMLKNSPNIGAGAITLRGDPRVLPFGKFLRKTKINELPQLLNILKGDMSLVGPRPLMKKQFNFYDKKDQNLISLMRPGLTGVASIVFRDEEKYFNNKTDPDKIYRKKIAPSKAILESWFYNNRTLWLYFKLIFLTIIAVLIPTKDFLKILDDETKEKLRDVLQKP